MSRRPAIHGTGRATAIPFPSIFPEVLSAAKMPSGDSNRLKMEVVKFLETVRAA